MNVIVLTRPADLAEDFDIDPIPLGALSNGSTQLTSYQLGIPAGGRVFLFRWEITDERMCVTGLLVRYTADYPPKFIPFTPTKYLEPDDVLDVRLTLGTHS
jgi:hypothetical protein